MDLSIKTGDVLILFLLKMILFTIFLSIHHLEGIAEVVFCFFKEGNAKSIIYKIMNDFTNEHSHLLFFLFFGISNCHAPEGKWMFFFPPWHPEQQIQGSYVGFDWEEFRQGSWRQLCWDKVNLVCKPVGKSVNVHS